MYNDIYINSLNSVTVRWTVGYSSGGKGWYRIAKSYYSARTTITKLYIGNFYSYASPNPMCIVIEQSHNSAYAYIEQSFTSNGLIKIRLVRSTNYYFYIDIQFNNNNYTTEGRADDYIFRLENKLIIRDVGITTGYTFMDHLTYYSATDDLNEGEVLIDTIDPIYNNHSLFRQTTLIGTADPLWSVLFDFSELIAMYPNFSFAKDGLTSAMINSYDKTICIHACLTNQANITEEDQKGFRKVRTKLFTINTQALQKYFKMNIGSISLVTATFSGNTNKDNKGYTSAICAPYFGDRYITVDLQNALYFPSSVSSADRFNVINLYAKFYYQ